MKSVSVFSGYGGLDLGLQGAGFQTVFAVDSNLCCAASYTRNFPGTPFDVGSVTEVELDLMRTVSSGQVTPGIEVLVGGPPCPPYSKSRFNRKSKPRALQDKVRRSAWALS